jgi:hypothetical protein
MNSPIESLQQMMCGLSGHDAVLHFERHRLSLSCLKCGHVTAGWILQPECRRAKPFADEFSPVDAQIRPASGDSPCHAHSHWWCTICSSLNCLGHATTRASQGVSRARYH